MLAGLLFGLEFLLIFVGLDYTSVARSTLLVNTMPFWVLIGGHFLLGEHMSVRKLAGLVLAFGGLVAGVFRQAEPAGPRDLFGDLLSLCAGLAWAATNFVIKRTQPDRASAEKLLLYQLAVSAVGAAAAAVCRAADPRSQRAADAALLFQAIYVVAFTYVLWFWLIRRYPASGLASFTFLTPAFGVLCGGLLLGEPLSPHLPGARADRAPV